MEFIVKIEMDKDWLKIALSSPLKKNIKNMILNSINLALSGRGKVTSFKVVD